MQLNESLAGHAPLLIFANVLVQQIGIPIPAEPSLVAAGVLVAKGLVSPWIVVVAAVTGSALADSAWFIAGRRYEGAVRRALQRWLPSKHSSRQSWLARWGLRSLLVVRFLPGAPQLILATLGASQVRPATFLLYDVAGVLLWASVPLTGGMLFHHQAETVLAALSKVAPWLAVAAIASLGGLFWHRRRARVSATDVSAPAGRGGGEAARAAAADAA
jgi:membrane protein DedA with SNARE-associated domain